MTRYLLLLFLLLSFGIFGQDNLQYSRSELRLLENSVTTEIKNNLTEYLGRDSKFSISTKINFKTPRNTIVGSSDDFGYLIFPKAEDMVMGKVLEITQVAVKVFLYENYSKQLKQNIEAIANGVTSGLGTSTKIEFVIFESPGVSFFNSFKDYSLPAAILFGAIVLAFSLITVVLVFFRMFKNSPLSMTEEMRDMPARSKASSTVSGNVGVKESDKENFERNIEVVKSVLQKNPYVLTTVLSSSDQDYMGLKKLMPSIMGLDSEIIKGVFTDKVILKIEEAQRTSKKMDKADFYMWFDSFVEKLSLQELKGGNRYLKSIDSKNVSKIYAIEPEVLIDYALNKKSGLIYKLVLLFLPDDIAKNLFDKFSANEWSMVLNEDGVSVDNINRAAAELVETVQVVKKDEVNDIQSKEALEEALIIPLVSYLSTKQLADYDNFLNQLNKFSPSIGEKITEKMWTPSIITKIPSNYLGSLLKSMDINERENLIIGFPSEISALLMNNLPEGRIKQVVVEMSQRPKESFSKDFLTSAERSCKSFLTDLKVSHDNKEFELRKVVKNMPISNANVKQKTKKAA